MNSNHRLPDSGEHTLSRRSGEGSLEDWLVVATSAAGILVSVLYIYSLGVFIGPIETEFGWSRVQITGGIAIVSVVSVLMAPFVGMGIDKWGPRRIAMLGMVIYCSAFATLASSTASIWHWWLLWLAVACGDILIKPTVWMAAITSRFDRRRGIAMGLALSGTGIGAAMLPYLASTLIQMGGWRFAFLVLGVAAGAIVAPIMFFLFRDVPRPQAAPGKSAVKLPGLSKREGLRSSRFYRMAIASLLVASGILGLMVHLVPILVEQGMVSQTAAGVAGAAGISSIVGRILTGFVLDRVRGTLVGAIAFGIPAFACFALLHAGGSVWSGIVAALIVGFCVGAELDIVAYLSAKYFGRRHYGMFLGSIVGLISMGAGLGSTAIGAMYDSFGSYGPVLWILAPIFLLGAAFIGTLGRYPEFAEPNPPDRTGE